MFSPKKSWDILGQKIDVREILSSRVPELSQVFLASFETRSFSRTLRGPNFPFPDTSLLCRCSIVLRLALAICLAVVGSPAFVENWASLRRLGLTITLPLLGVFALVGTCGLVGCLAGDQSLALVKILPLVGGTCNYVESDSFAKTYTHYETCT